MKTYIVSTMDGQEREVKADAFMTQPLQYGGGILATFQRGGIGLPTGGFAIVAAYANVTSVVEKPELPRGCQCGG